ncbi:MAG: hypothetical protein AAF587_25310 [Bacteroidota bacterium]
MRIFFLLCFSLILYACPNGNAQAPSSIPDTYQLLFEHTFEEAASVSDFEMTDPSAWRIQQKEGNHSLELFGASQYKPAVRSPRNIAFIKAHQFEDFVMEVKLAQTGKEYGHRDMCLFFGMKDASNFYYVHMATKADPHAHNIFLVNDEPRVAIAEKTTDGIDWGEVGQWHSIRLERKVSEGVIRVFFDDMDTPIMTAKDTHFGAGYLGFGSFDDTGMIDNIKIWGPKVATRKYGFF